MNFEKLVWRKKLNRADWTKEVVERIAPDCWVGMEACTGAHHWAMQLQRLGYKVKVIAPQFVKPYFKSNKNDANDAEAMSRPNMRFVAVKTVEQQDMQAVHRIRSELVSQWTAKANQIRGLVAEYGLVAPRELLQLRMAIACWLEDMNNGLIDRSRRLLAGLQADLQQLDDRMESVDFFRAGLGDLLVLPPYAS